MPILRQSTSITITMGPYLDNVDGNTERTGLTIAQANVRLSKNGGAYAQKNDANSATHQEMGNYSVPLNSTDTNTPGRLRVYTHPTSSLPVWADFIIMTSNAYEALVSGGEFIKADVHQFAAVSGTFSLGIPYVNTAYIAGSVGAATLLAGNAGNLDTTISSRATPAQVSTAMVSAMVDYDVASSADVSTLVSVVGQRIINNNQIPSSAAVSTIVITALTQYDSPTSADVSSIVAALVSFGGATQNQVSAAVKQALTDHDVLTSADIPIRVEVIAVSAGAIGDGAFNVSALQRQADYVLRRGVTAAEAASATDTLQFGSLLGMVGKHVNKIAVSGSTLNIFRADATTTLGSQSLQTTTSASPFTGLTPQ
jgi:hypothetical protein